MDYRTRWITALLNRAAHCARDTGGNVAMLFGLTVVPLLLAIGIAVDYNQAAAVQQKLNGTVDAIALASARAHDDENLRQTIGQKFLDGNMGDYLNGLTVQDLVVEFDDETKTVSVRVTAKVPTHLMSIAGIEEQTVSSRSKVSYEGHVSEPVSLAMVLDVSGSMGWNNKIGTLRSAATTLLDKLDVADPDAQYVRTGLVTYSNSIQQTENMDWGIDDTRPIVQGLTANGGTASTSAVSAASGWLRGNSENAQHAQQPVHEGEEFELHRFMIFMTDGDNNRRSDDTNTKRKCDQAKDDGVEVFTVAFEAPRRGRELLEYCATSDDHYFDADNSADFLAAFEEIGDRIESALLLIVE